MMKCNFEQQRILPSSSIFVAFAAMFGLTVGCADDKPAKKFKEPVSSGSSSSESKEESAPAVSGDVRSLTTSLSNNPFTSKTVDKAKAADLANQYSNSKAKDIASLEAAIEAHRLAGHSVNEVMAPAKSLADLEMSKNVDKEIPETAQLELGLSGIQTGRLAFAEFWLDKLLKSKNASIRAAAINAKGVVAIRTDRIPEAMFLFREALAAKSDFKPALLNIGFLALQGGDAATAKKALSGMQDDWYVESGLVSVHRLEGEADKAEGSCEKVLSKHPKHKPTLINCGVNAWQGKKDYKKAREYLNKALAVPGGASFWDERSGRLLGTIDVEESRAAQAKSLKEAEERKAKSDAEKAKAAPAAGPPAGAPSGNPPPKQ
ncbi:MAG: hypothetical protein NTV34_00425 [Proteobacteria bacterium]|nr:hypothetical protein [Pseudomonadota bacterium]